MTPEHTALVARLESKDPMVVALAGDEAAAAIRALAGEVERRRLDAKQAGEATEKMHASWSPLVVLNERLRAEVERLKGERP